MKVYKLLFASFISFFLFASLTFAQEVKVSKIELVDKTDSSGSGLNEVVEDNQVNLNIGFSNVNDYIKYKVTIVNDDNADYYISGSKIKDQHLEYTIGGDDVIKAKSTSNVYVTFLYNNEVNQDDLKDEIYKISDVIELSFISDDIANNPKTGLLLNIILVLFAAFVSIFVIIYTKKHNNASKNLMLIILLICIIPTTLYAASNDIIKINVNASIYGGDYANEFIDNYFPSDDVVDSSVDVDESTINNDSNDSEPSDIEDVEKPSDEEDTKEEIIPDDVETDDLDD